MRLSTIIIAVLVMLSSSGYADEHLLNSASEWKKATVRLGDEASGVVTAPFTTESNAVWWTLATVGAVGITYLFDDEIRDSVQARKSSALGNVTDVGSIIGDPFLHIGLAAVVYGGGILADSPKYRELGEMMGEAVLLADATSFVLKETVGRERPFVSGNRENFKPLRFKNDNDSFPSMHTASSFALASVLASTSDTLLTKVAYYTLATFVGFSRLYQDKHWASDVVLGAAVGELCGSVVTKYHASGKRNKIVMLPQVSENSVTLSLGGSF